MKNLNAYRDQAYKIACEHGFHDEERSIEHWKCLIVSELMEAVEADRKGKRANIKAFNTRQIVGKGSSCETLSYSYNFGLCIKDTVEDELADACIRILDLAGYKNIDLQFEAEKSDKNSQIEEFTGEVFKIVGTMTIVILDLCLSYALIQIFSLADRMGIDIGSTTVKVVLADEKNEIAFARYRRHFSEIKKTVKDILKEAKDNGH